MATSKQKSHACVKKERKKEKKKVKEKGDEPWVGTNPPRSPKGHKGLWAQKIIEE